MDSNRQKEDLSYVLSLTKVKNITPIDIKRLLESFTTPGAIFGSDRNSLAKCLDHRKNPATIAELILRFNDFDWAKIEMEKAEKLGISIVSLLDKNYPGNLKYITDPPPILYISGKILPEDSIAVAVVGTRLISNYGRTATSRLVRDLSAYGITVVSGLARGVDSIAHREAISSGGRTIAAMATGADITYPPENKKLRQEIEQNGAVVTEFSLGTSPDRWRFPVRNRIIAGLALGSVVVEAPVKSGALITARLAAEYNREVFAVPGNITCNSSAGCNKLIKEGAKAVTEVGDILEEFDIDFVRNKSVAPDLSTLTDDDRTVFNVIEEEGTVVELIMQRCSLPPFAVNSILMQLELKGILKRLPGNIYIRS